MLSRQDIDKRLAWINANAPMLDYSRAQEREALETAKELGRLAALVTIGCDVCDLDADTCTPRPCSSCEAIDSLREWYRGEE